MKHLVLGAITVAAFAGVGLACDDSDDAFDATVYAGTYSGTWTNAATGATGPATITIDVDEDARTASLTLDFGGNYLGLGDPPPATLAGVFDDDGATVKGTSELFGTYDVTIDRDGKIVGLMENLGGGAVPKVDYTGKLTATTMDADYHVTQKDGSTATAVLKLTKPR